MIHLRVRDFWNAPTRAGAVESLYEARRDVERYFEKHSRKAFAIGFASGAVTVLLFPSVVALAFLVGVVGWVRYLMKSGAEAVGQSQLMGA